MATEEREEARRRARTKAAEVAAIAAPRSPRTPRPSRRGSRRSTRRSAIPALTKQFAYKNPNQVPRLQKIVVNMGLGAAVDEPEDHRLRRRRAPRAHRPEAGRHPRQEGDRDLQAPRGPPHRRDGHAPPRAHVGVPRSPDRVRAPARARLPGVSRRASTARATTRSGLQGADHLPRDRLRPDRRHQGAQHLLRDHGARPTKRGARSSASWACRSGQPERSERKTKMARACQFAKLNRAPEVFDASPQPLQGLRSRSRLLPQLRALPICLRLFALRGEIPGVIKASW